ncbi:RNA 2',3'-cyclic phosphodiesterase [Paenibacillus thalictri]|uniref:RNA 2',3'-cyclic phosphodiesterase n=1 Tax=Paenibacillus thalictri TaxID=2527873 RepID=A0A4Q9DG81_9BACL|nr:RNA 2',3'-cyclic phosphodiesterase [Paenibacillus thalictri]TBL70065.1 RNA 2',3'-cyclic phosphodiesterase [Paenibacillus thalictri]
MSEHFRLFIAVPVSTEVKLGLKTICEPLKERLLSFQKWVHPEDMHITVQFLGNTPEDKLPAIRSHLESIAAGTAPLHLITGDLGVFGKPSSPSILWAGVKGDTDRLETLHRQVEQAMQQHGYEPEDRAYSPHITLARRYQGNAPFNRQEGLSQAYSPLVWTADRLALYRSHLNRTPMYEMLYAFALNHQT